MYIVVIIILKARDFTTSGSGYISHEFVSEYGSIPSRLSGSDSTYYADYCWFNNSVLCYLLSG